MPPAETHRPPRGKLAGIARLLVTILVGVGVFLFRQHLEKDDARHREAMRTLEESKGKIEAIQREVDEIQQRK